MLGLGLDFGVRTDIDSEELDDVYDRHVQRLGNAEDIDQVGLDSDPSAFESRFEEGHLVPVIGVFDCPRYGDGSAHSL